MSRRGSCISFHVTASALTLHRNFNERCGTFKIRRPSKSVISLVFYKACGLFYLFSLLATKWLRKKGKTQRYQLDVLLVQRETWASSKRGQSYTSPKRNLFVSIYKQWKTQCFLLAQSSTYLMKIKAIWSLPADYMDTHNFGGRGRINVFIKNKWQKVAWRHI